jgi:hypothetical protein
MLFQSRGGGSRTSPFLLTFLGELVYLFKLAHDFNVIGQKHYPYREAATYAMMGGRSSGEKSIPPLLISEVQNAQDASLCRMELYYARYSMNCFSFLYCPLIQQVPQSHPRLPPR